MVIRYFLIQKNPKVLISAIYWEEIYCVLPNHNDLGIL